jgi:hypothetical protein
VIELKEGDGGSARLDYYGPDDIKISRAGEPLSTHFDITWPFCLMVSALLQSFQIFLVLIQKQMRWLRGPYFRFNLRYRFFKPIVPIMC